MIRKTRSRARIVGIIDLLLSCDLVLESVINISNGFSVEPAEIDVGGGG